MSDIINPYKKDDTLNPVAQNTQAFTQGAAQANTPVPQRRQYTVKKPLAIPKTFEVPRGQSAAPQATAAAQPTAASVPHPAAASAPAQTPDADGKTFADYGAERNAKAAALSQIRAENAEHYQTQLPPWEYEVLNSHFKDVAEREGLNAAEEERFKYMNALQYSRMYDIPFSQALQNVDDYNRALFGVDPDSMSYRGKLERLGDAWTQGVNTIKRSNLGKDLIQAEMRGDTETAQTIWDAINALDAQNEALSPNQPQALGMTILTAGLQSVPYTAYAGVAGFLGGMVGVGPLAGFAAGYDLMRADSYINLRQAGADEETSRNVSALSGALQAAVEQSLGIVAHGAAHGAAVAGGKALSGITKGVERTLADKVTKLAFSHFKMQGTAARIATSFAAHHVADLFEEGAEEAVQEVIDGLSFHIANALSENDVETDDARTIAKNSVEAFKGGVCGALFLGVFDASLSAQANIRDYKDLREAAETIPSREAFKKATAKNAAFEGMSDEKKSAMQDAIFDNFDNARTAAVQEELSEVRATTDVAEGTEARKEDSEGNAVQLDREVRDEEGRLYMQDDERVAQKGDGAEHGRVLFGDPTRAHSTAEDGNRYGYIDYSVRGDTVTIDGFKMGGGREYLRQEAFEQFAERFAGKNIEWNTTQESDARAKQALVAANPYGKEAGLNYYKDFNVNTADMDAQARLRLAKEVRKNMPRLKTAKERSLAIAMIELAAKSDALRNVEGKRFSGIADWYNQSFSKSGMFGDEAELNAAAVAQGNIDENGKPIASGGMNWKQFEDGVRAVIYTGAQHDITTLLHEVGHVWRKQLSPEMRQEFERLFGVTNGDWNAIDPRTGRIFEETFTETLDKWYSTGDAPTSALQRFFKELAQFVARVLHAMEAQSLLSPEISAAYKKLFSDDASVFAKADEAVREADRQLAEEQRKAQAEKRDAARREEAKRALRETTAEHVTRKAAEIADSVIQGPASTEAEQAQAALDAAAMAYETETIDLGDALFQTADGGAGGAMLFQTIGFHGVENLAKEMPEYKPLLANRIETARFIESEFTASDSVQNINRRLEGTRYKWRLDLSRHLRVDVDTSNIRWKNERFLTELLKGNLRGAAVNRTNAEQVFSDSDKRKGTFIKTTVALEELVDSPLLFAANPTLRGITVSVVNSNADVSSYMKDGQIQLNARALTEKGGLEAAKDELTARIEELNNEWENAGESAQQQKLEDAHLQAELSGNKALSAKLKALIQQQTSFLNGYVAAKKRRLHLAQAAMVFQIAGEAGAESLDKTSPLSEGVTRMENLATAKVMDDGGKSAEDIRRATGWEKGVDGKWRYEIDDGAEKHDARRALSDLSVSTDMPPDAGISRADKARAMLALTEDVARDDQIVLRDAQRMLFQTACHGSGASFDRFSTEHINEGEGSQSFGWGLYFSGSASIARNYAERQGSDPNIIERLQRKYRDLYAHIIPIWNNMSVGDSFAEAKKNYIDYLRENHVKGIQEIARKINEISEDDFLKADLNRNLYTVSLPDGEYLRWDEPVSQSVIDRVRAGMDRQGRADWGARYDEVYFYKGKRIESSWEDELYSETFDPYRYAARALYFGGSKEKAVEYLHKDMSNFGDTISDERRRSYDEAVELVNASSPDDFSTVRDYGNGDKLYHNLEDFFESDETASKFLRSIGYVGIDYPAGTIHGGGDGVRNYVIFDDKDIEITSHMLFQTADAPASYEEAGEILKGKRNPKGNTLHNDERNMDAVVSNNNIKKMTRGQKLNDGVPPKVHAVAVANLDQLFKAAAKAWDKPDRAGDPNIKQIDRFIAPLFVDDDSYIAMMTVKEFNFPKEQNGLYTVEELNIQKDPAGLTKVADADNIDLIAFPLTGSAENVIRAVQSVKRARTDFQTDNAGTLFQTEVDMLREAAEFGSWQDWKEYYEATGGWLGDDESAVPAGADDAWYKTAWEKARAMADAAELTDENVERITEDAPVPSAQENEDGIDSPADDERRKRKAKRAKRENARQTDPAESAETQKDAEWVKLMEEDGALDRFLWVLGNDWLKMPDAPADEEEAAEVDRILKLRYRADAELKHGSWGTAALKARQVQYGEDVQLTDRHRKTLMTLIRRAPRDYRDLWAAYMKEDGWRVAEGMSTAERIAGRIQSPVENVLSLTPEERRAFAEKLDFEDLKKEVKDGSFEMDFDNVEKLVKGYEADIRALEDRIEKIKEHNAGNEQELVRQNAQLEKLMEELKQKQEARRQAEAVRDIKIRLIKDVNKRVDFRRVNYDEGRKIIAIQALFQPLLKKYVNQFINMEGPYIRDAYSRFKTDYNYRSRMKSLADNFPGKGARKLKKVLELFETKAFDKWTEEERLIVAENLPRTDWVRELDLEAIEAAREGSLQLDLQSEETQRLLRDTLPPELLAELSRKELRKWSLEQMEGLVRVTNDLFHEGKEKLAAKREADIRRADDLRRKIEQAVKSSGIVINDDDTPEEKERKEKAIARFKEKVTPRILGTESGVKGTLSAKKGMGAFFSRVLHGYGTMNVRRVARILDNGKDGVNTSLLYWREDECFNNKARAIKKQQDAIKSLMEKQGIRMEELYETVDLTLPNTIMAPSTNGGMREVVFEPTEKTIRLTIDELLYAYAAKDNERSYKAVAGGNLFDETVRARFRLNDTGAFEDMADARMKKLLATAADFLASEKGAKFRPLLAAIQKAYDEQGIRLNETAIRVYNAPMWIEEHYVPLNRLEANGDTNEAKLKDEMLAGIAGTGSAGSWIARGNMKSRADISLVNQKPVQMGLLSTWAESVESTEHIIAYGELVRDLNRIYRGRDAAAMKQYMENRWGRDMVQYIDQYIKEVANPNLYKNPKTDLDRIVRTLRGKTAPAYLAWKMSGIIKQFCTSPWPYMQYMTPQRYLKACIDCMKRGTKDAIKTKSAYMNSRVFDPLVDLMNEQAQKATGRAAHALSQFQTLGMQGLEWVDWTCVAPGWLAVYEDERARLASAKAQDALVAARRKELESYRDANGDEWVEAEAEKARLDDGEIERLAVRKADDVVRMAQPSSRSTDLSPLFKNSNELSKVLLQFTSSLNVIWQNIRSDLPAAVKNRELGQIVGCIAGYVLAGVTVGFISEGFDDDDDDAKKKAARFAYWSMTQFTDAVPVIGAAVTSTAEGLLTHNWSYGSAMSDLFPVSTKAINAVKYADKGRWDKALENFGYSVGLSLGLPTSGIKELLYVSGIGDGADGVTLHPTALTGRRPQ